MSNSSDSSSPVDSKHASLCDEPADDGGGTDHRDSDNWTCGLETRISDGLFKQLKVIEQSDQVRELQTIIRDRSV